MMCFQKIAFTEPRVGYCEFCLAGIERRKAQIRALHDSQSHKARGSDKKDRNVYAPLVHRLSPMRRGKVGA